MKLTLRMDSKNGDGSTPNSTPSDSPETPSLREQILKFILDDPHITKKEISDKTSATMYAIKKELSVLKDEGIAEYVGYSRNGHWEVRKAVL